jgi:iron complex outermembrane recepter protein
VQSGAVTSNGTVTGITTTVFPGNEGFGQVVRGVNEKFFFKDDLYAGGLNAKYQKGGWTVAADIAYSTTHRDQQFLTLRTQAFGAVPTTSFQSTAGQAPVMNISLDLTDPSIYRVADFQIPENGGGAPIINDELKSGSLDIARELGGFFRDIQFGARFTDRSKDYTQRTQFGFIDPAARTPIPASLLNGPLRFAGEYSNIPGVLSLDIDRAVAQYFGPVAPTTSLFDQRSSWVVAEKTYAGYGQMNIDGNLAGLDVLGNFGVRVIRTEGRSSSTRIDQTDLGGGNVVTTVTPVSVANNFTDVLPNINLTFKPTSKLQVRLGASRAIARAPLDDLNAGFGLFTFGAPSAFGGNPNLEPFRANQADATVEWYINRDTAITVAGFYKDLASYIVQQVTLTDVLDPAGSGNTVQQSFRQPVNGSGGTIKGFEVSLQTAFSFLPAPLDGFGVYANYSYTDSSITVQENDNAIGTIPLPGLSKHVLNLVGYYSKAGFEARVGYRYRSSYATELGDTDRILFTAPEGIVDAQLSYEFPEDSGIGGLQLLFQANNLTNQAFETYYGDRAQQGRYEKFGTRYLFGIGFKL